MFEKLAGPLREAVAFNEGKAKTRPAGKKRLSKTQFPLGRDLELRKGVKMIAVANHPVISHITSFKQAPGGEDPIYLYSHKETLLPRRRGFRVNFNLGKLRQRLEKSENRQYTVESAGFRGLYFLYGRKQAETTPQLVGRINFYGYPDNSFHIGLAAEHAEALARLLLEGDDAPITAVKAAKPKP